MAKRPLTVWEATFSAADIGQALKVSPDDVIRKFRDGRVASWFAEIWGEQLFRYKTHASSNHPGSDGLIDLGVIGDYEVSVRCLTRSGIKFQKSSQMGSGRSATQGDLEAALRSVERVVVVDIRNFPMVFFLSIDSKWLLQLCQEGCLTTAGLSSEGFYRLLVRDFDLKFREKA